MVSCVVWLSKCNRLGSLLGFSFGSKLARTATARIVLSQTMGYFELLNITLSNRLVLVWNTGYPRTCDITPTARQASTLLFRSLEAGDELRIQHMVSWSKSFHHLPSQFSARSVRAQQKQKRYYKRPKNLMLLFSSFWFSSKTMPSLTAFVHLAALVAVAVAIPTDNSTILGSRTETAKRATCTVNSVASAANLSACTAVIITAFTVPSGSKKPLC